MNEEEKKEILDKSRKWYREEFIAKHINNVRKLSDPKEFNINPFTVNYISNFLDGELTPEGIAKALIYPRAIGTSLVTTFGSSIQKFTAEVLGAYKSLISGLDIEFIDQLDGRHKYCQLKSGPNNINKADVKTISDDFNKIRNLGRTNNLKVEMNDLIVGVLYGERKDLSVHYLGIERKHNYNVIIGQNFWHRLTGDEDFYFDLIGITKEIAQEVDFSVEFKEIVSKLAGSEIVKKLTN